MFTSYCVWKKKYPVCHQKSFYYCFTFKVNFYFWCNYYIQFCRRHSELIKRKTNYRSYFLISKLLFFFFRKLVMIVLFSSKTMIYEISYCKIFIGSNKKTLLIQRIDVSKKITCYLLELTWKKQGGKKWYSKSELHIWCGWSRIFGHS